MKGYSYSKATPKYFEKLFLEKSFVFLEKDKKNLVGVWEKHNIKTRKLLGFINISGQHTSTFISELKNGNYLVNKPAYFKNYERLDKEFKELSEAIDYNEYLINQKNKKIIRSEFISLIIIILGFYLYIGISAGDLLWVF